MRADRIVPAHAGDDATRHGLGGESSRNCPHKLIYRIYPLIAFYDEADVPNYG